MTARAEAGHGPTVSGLHLRMSKLLVSCLTVAVAATGALVLTLIVGFPERPGPPPGIPGVVPGPPPNYQGVAVLVVVTGVFVLAWLAVLVAFSRDQILSSISPENPETMNAEQMRNLLNEVRTELAADREREWQILSERLAEYGEQRETDGYLNGMRVATESQPVDANVRSIRRPPAPR
ncbi:hypothetical protein [Actinoplanes sp. NPDC049316]|uniref:hypothetical protein n=1 Tax=Actinoplanes sp. NPDC049316 TaxID=3154727 RepID=UPI0034403596